MSLSYNISLDPVHCDVIARLQEQHDYQGRLSITIQSQPTRQGHHYYKLAEQWDCGGEDPWIMFTDDDDLWSPNRTAVLTKILADVGNDTGVDAVYVPWHARHAGRIPDVDRRVCLHAATALVGDLWST